MIADSIDRLESGLISFLIGAMTLITFFQVVARYVFNYSFVWALELVTFMFAWMIFLGISYGVKVGSHIGLDAVTRALPPTPRRIVGIIACLLCMVYCVILFVGSWQYVEKMYIIGILAHDLPIPQWVPRLVLPLGFALTFLRFGQVFYSIVTGKSEGLHLGDEAADALKAKLLETGEELGRATRK